MKKVAFVGAYDKIDFIIYVAKVLTEYGKTVMIIDGTILQKTRYIVPAINPGPKYMTTFEDIDFCVGFRSQEEIKQYLNMQIANEFQYDYVLIDVDTPEMAATFAVDTFNLFYYVSSMDLYSIIRGLTVFDSFRQPVTATKIMYLKHITKQDDEYINYLAQGRKVNFNPNDIVYLPFENGDLTIIYENQRVKKIRLKKISEQFKSGVLYVASQIADAKDYRELLKPLKILEKGV